MVCGSEVILVHVGKGVLRPVCCNEPMAPMKELIRVYRCPVCGSEAAVIRTKSDGLRLVCCNVPMRVLAA